MKNLTYQENQIYFDLLKLYNLAAFKICSLESFIAAKYESETNPTRAAKIYNVLQFAQTNLY